MVMHWKTVRMAKRMLSKLVMPKLGPVQYSLHSVPLITSIATHGWSPTLSPAHTNKQTENKPLCITYDFMPISIIIRPTHLEGKLMQPLSPNWSNTHTHTHTHILSFSLRHISCWCCWLKGEAGSSWAHVSSSASYWKPHYQDKLITCTVLNWNNSHTHITLTTCQDPSHSGHRSIVHTYTNMCIHTNTASSWNSRAYVLIFESRAVRIQ